MHLLPHCFCLNLLLGRDRLILLCLNETVCYIRFNHLACTANITIMHNELLFCESQTNTDLQCSSVDIATTQLADIITLNLHGNLEPDTRKLWKFFLKEMGISFKNCKHFPEKMWKAH